SPFFFFFFSSRRRHTRFSRDWSSDVCSSDLYFCLLERTISQFLLFLLTLEICCSLMTVRFGNSRIYLSMAFLANCGLKSFLTTWANESSRVLLMAISINIPIQIPPSRFLLPSICRTSEVISSARIGLSINITVGTFDLAACIAADNAVMSDPYTNILGFTFFCAKTKQGNSKQRKVKTLKFIVP